MAKLTNLDVKGLSIEDIRELDTRSLSDRALKQALNRLSSAANKRLRRLQSDDIAQHAPSAQTKHFSAKGLDTRGKIKAEFDRARAFLDPSKKSHTVKGWKTITKKMEQRGVSRDNIVSPDFWSLFRSLYDKYVPSVYDSDTLLILVSSLVDNETPYSDIDEELQRVYEMDEAEQEEYFGDLEDEFGDYYD